MMNGLMFTWTSNTRNAFTGNRGIAGQYFILFFSLNLQDIKEIKKMRPTQALANFPVLIHLPVQVLLGTIRK
jgi:hypothetical protein